MRRQSAVSLIALATLLVGCGKDDSTGPGTSIFGCNRVQGLTIGESVSGSLSASDCLDPGDGARADYYQFTLSARGPVSITVQSPSGTLIVAILDLNENVYGFEFAAPGSSAVVGGELDAGRYVLVVAGTAEGQTATYSFTSSRTLPPPPPAFLGCATSQAYTVGATVAGTLATSDCVASNGKRLDRYDFTVSSSRSVTIDLESSDFDTYLYLFDGTGVLLAENDDSSTGTNSTLTITLNAGSYSIGASTFTPGDLGAYSISSR